MTHYGTQMGRQRYRCAACTSQISKVQAIPAPYVKRVSHLCSDVNGTWRVFASDAGVPHVELSLAQKVRVRKRIYYIQNVNTFHKRLRDWMNRSTRWPASSSATT